MSTAATRTDLADARADLAEYIVAWQSEYEDGVDTEISEDLMRDALASVCRLRNAVGDLI